MNNERTGIVVVGGGLAGLTAAAYAARAGAHVTVLERTSAMGGRAATAERSGFKINRGAHALYLGGAGENVLHELGVPFSGATPDFRRYRVVRHRRFHRFVGDVPTLFTTRLFNARERFEASRLLMRAQKADLAALAGTPLARWLEDNARSDVVRAYFESVVRLATFTHDPERISAGAALAPLRGATVIFVDGGWQTLVDGLRESAIAAGAGVATQCPVEKVGPNDAGGAFVALADGHRFEAAAVVLAIGPEEAAELVAGTPWEAASQTWRTSEPVRAATLDLGLRRLPVPQRPIVISQDQPIYAAAHSTIAKLAPAGQALLSIVRYLAPGESSDASTLAGMEAFVDLVQPGWRELEIDRQYLPSMIVSNRELLASQGGTLGRPPVQSPSAPRLFVAGDWVGENGALSEAVFASAKAAGQAAATIAARHALAVAS